MSKYNQTNIVGESWLRAKRIVIDNPYNAPKNVKFVEEKVFQLADKVLTEQSDVLNIKIATEEEMLESIDIIDPTTNEPTGQTITYQELYAIIFSAYLKQAKLRDEPPVVEETTNTTDTTTGEEGTA